VRAAAAKALERLGPDAVAPHLVAIARLLGDEAAEARQGAAACLGEGGALAGRLGHATRLAEVGRADTPRATLGSARLAPCTPGLAHVQHWQVHGANYTPA